MSDQTSTNRTIVIRLGVIAVLLVATAGHSSVGRTISPCRRRPRRALPRPLPASRRPGADTAQGGHRRTCRRRTGMPGATAALPPASRPRLRNPGAQGNRARAFVKAYYEAVDADDWETAFKSLPADKQAGQLAGALKEQVTGYGVRLQGRPRTEEGDRHARQGRPGDRLVRHLREHVDLREEDGDPGSWPTRPSPA